MLKVLQEMFPSEIKQCKEEAWKRVEVEGTEILQLEYNYQ
jgi:hypothetical protein